MSKTLETKKRILNLLKKRNMTISDLSRELNLTTATVSQHMDELQKIGAVEKIDNEHFKKLKYYRATQTSINPLFAKYAIGAIVIIALIGIFYVLSSGIQANNASAKNTSVSSALTSSSNITTGGFGGQTACPRLFYTISGKVDGYTGFTKYELNSSEGNVSDYVISPGSTGTLHVTENVSSLQSQPQNESHYYFVNKVGRTFNTSAPGVSVSLSPQDYVISGKEIVTFNATVTINQTATKQTYWLTMDGPCGGGVIPVLITVGNGPYNGTVTHSGLPYA